MPACNPGGNFEFTLGGALARAHGEADSGAVLVQGKTLFRKLESNGFGIGLAAGYATQPGNGQSARPTSTFRPVFRWPTTALSCTANLGATYDRENRGTRLTWGLGSEIQTSERLYVIAESYGQDKGNPSSSSACVTGWCPIMSSSTRPGAASSATSATSAGCRSACA